MAVLTSNEPRSETHDKVGCRLAEIGCSFGHACIDNDPGERPIPQMPRIKHRSVRVNEHGYLMRVEHQVNFIDILNQLGGDILHSKSIAVNRLSERYQTPDDQRLS